MDLMPIPGEIYLLPPESDAEILAGKGPRPHLVLSHARPDQPVITLAYGTTKSKEAVAGAPFIEIAKTSPLFDQSGLREATFFYTSRLVAAHPDDMDQRIGSIEPIFPEILNTMVPRGLGIGTGTCREGGPASGSHRGSVIELNRKGIDLLGFQYAVVVSDPLYSRRNFYWNVIPIINGDGAIEVPPELVVGGLHDWFYHLGVKKAHLLTPFVQGIHVGDYFSRPLIGVDGETMRRIDRALGAHFRAPTTS